jgi:hypothetical protein
MTGNWIWRRLTNNIGWKLISLFVAFALWLAVAGEPELVAILSIPVLYRNLSPVLLLLSDAPGEVHAELRGPSGKLTHDMLSSAVASLDLAAVVSPGDQTFTLSAADFSLPQGVRFVRAVPSQLQLRFDRMLTKTVPVELQLRGKSPAGYVITAKSTEPQALSISGPETSLRSIVSTRTDPVDISSLIQTTDLKVNAFVAEPRAQFESEPVVTVRLTIEKSEKPH